MLSFYGNGGGAGDGGSTAEQLWEKGNVLGAVQQITTASTYSNSARGDGSVAEGLGTTATAECHSEGFKTAALKVASHAEGSSSTANGSNSHVEGYKTLASTFRAHAEGFASTASGTQSHAEGGLTLASGEAAHTEGQQTTASGLHSHAEGEGTRAGSQMSHAEGWLTTVTGDNGHAEGRQTSVTGSNGHAQNYGTIAASHAQTALGKFNIEDNQDQHAVILGNGNSTASRSNAAFIDWNGNTSIAGNLTLNMNSTNSATLTADMVNQMGSTLPVVIVEESPGESTHFYYNDNELSWQNLADIGYILKTNVDFSSYGYPRRIYITNYSCIKETGQYNLYFLYLDSFINGFIIFNRVKFTFNNETATVASPRSEDKIQVAFGAYV